MGIHKVSVIGAGTMGNGIAQTFAQKGFQVTLFDVSPYAISQGLNAIENSLNRLVLKEKITTKAAQSAIDQIQSFDRLEKAVEKADLVIEAATENKVQKQQIFEDLDTFTLPHCILASNTSSIKISSLEQVTQRKGKVIGMHFFNPVPLMQLVEIIRTPDTLENVFQTIYSLAEQLDKVPVKVNDAPGFVANRILMPMINEAVKTLESGVAGVFEIDTVMRLGMAHPMGPLRLADYIGLDVCVAILEVLATELNQSQHKPAALLQDLVQQGCLGQKTGQGFYDYRQDPKHPTVHVLK